MGSGNGTAAENNRTTSLTTLPATWTAGPAWTGGAPSFYASSAVTVPPDPPDQVGQWGDVMDWPIVAAHAVLMTSGKTLEIDGWTAPSPSIVYDQSLGGVAGGGFTRIDNPLGLDVFCAGNVTLPDGRILLAGGHGFTATLGLQETTIYDPSNDTWVAGPKMQYARWYPTATELGDGRIVDDQRQHHQHELGRHAGGLRPGHQQVVDDAVDQHLRRARGGVPAHLPAAQRQDHHDRDVGRPDLHAGPADAVLDAGPRDAPRPATRSGIMYRPGKILLTGGGTPLNTNNAAQTGAETMDTTVANPTWTPAQPMLKARYAHTLTDTPDGKVLAIGGGGDMNQEDLASGELSAETWDPDTGAWTRLASMPVPRLYHSTSMLMPDGRILVTGGGHADGPQSPSEYNAEFYSPPYLFKGARPSISSVPSSATYGSSIEVRTPDADSIRSVSLDQPGGRHAHAGHEPALRPADVHQALGRAVGRHAGLAEPGAADTYMLFIVNDRGVPSIAPFIKVAPTTVAPTVNVTTPAAGATVNGTVPLTATASDTTGITSLQFTVDGTAVGPRLTSAPYTYNWDSTTVANGPHTIGAVAVNGVGTRGTANPVSVTANNAGLMSPTQDGVVSAEGNGTINSPALSTTGSADVVLAFATSDGPATGQTLTVSGGGLTWSLVKRVNARGGSTEIWKAKATSAP